MIAPLTEQDKAMLAQLRRWHLRHPGMVSIPVVNYAAKVHKGEPISAKQLDRAKEEYSRLRVPKGILNPSTPPATGSGNSEP